MADRNRPPSGFCLFWDYLCSAFILRWEWQLFFGRIFRFSWIGPFGHCLESYWLFTLFFDLCDFGKIGSANSGVEIL